MRNCLIFLDYIFLVILSPAQHFYQATFNLMLTWWILEFVRDLTPLFSSSMSNIHLQALNTVFPKSDQ